jgi:uncharacterized protein YecE (DUF72 family)
MPVPRIGTSGWSYAGWVGPFYPQGARPADCLSLPAEMEIVAFINNHYAGHAPATCRRLTRLLGGS